MRKEKKMTDDYIKFRNIHGTEHFWIAETNVVDIFTLGQTFNARSAFKIQGIKMLQDLYWKKERKMFGDSARPLKVILTFTDKIDWEVIEKDE